MSKNILLNLPGSSHFNKNKQLTTVYTSFFNLFKKVLKQNLKKTEK